jgi:hypothetical protein
MTDRTLRGRLPHRRLIAAVVGLASVAGVTTAFGATKFVNDKPENGIAFTRPLCPHP